MTVTAGFRAALTALLISIPVVGCLNTSHEDSTRSLSTVVGQCTFTQGYWKNHPEAWPVSSLQLGSVTYTKEQLLAILNQPVRGNGLVSLARQLIAAKLNIAFGAPDTDIGDEILAADALIGGKVVPPVGDGYLHPSQSSSLNDAIDTFNNSQLSGSECVPEPYCGDGNVDPGEECDDGNTDNGDGCSATCEIEKAPCCGDGYLDAGEECADGNTTSGDGCSATCTLEVSCYGGC
jgi:cysteine-rich repeat protein